MLKMKAFITVRKNLLCTLLVLSVTYVLVSHPPFTQSNWLACWVHFINAFLLPKNRVEVPCKIYVIDSNYLFLRS